MKYELTKLIDFVRNCMANELDALTRESEGRRVALLEKAEEARHEWTRAEQAEARIQKALELSYRRGLKGSEKVEAMREALEGE